MKAERVQSHETNLGNEIKFKTTIAKKNPNLSRLGNRSSYERGEITSANDSLSFLVDFYRSGGFQRERTLELITSFSAETVLQFRSTP